MATKAATFWLQRHKAKTQRTSSLHELAASEVASPIQLHKLDNFVANIGIQVAENLEPLLATRFKSLPDNEIQAALDAASDALDAVDLSDDALLAANANPDDLAKHIRSRSPDQARIAGLSEAATQVYEAALNQACRYLVQVVLYLPTFQPRALAETLTRLSNQTAQLEELLARIPRTSLHAPSGTQHDAEFTTAYLSHISSTLDKLELLGLNAHEQPRLKLTIAYLSLSVSQTQRSRAKRDQLAHHWFREPESGGGSLRVEEAVGSADRVLVRGEAGSGKTTLLDWLAVTAARSQFTGGLAEWNDHVPFPIRLRSFASGPLPVPEEFVRHAWPMASAEMPAGWVHRRLRDGRSVVLVDGVDEVPVRRRKEVQAWLRDLVDTFPKIKVVVTARPAAVDEKWLAEEKFGSVTLEQMGADDIRKFIERWHVAASHATPLPSERVDLPAAEQRLMTQFDSRPHLRTLAANPLLCAMLCALNLNHASELPRSRMELYQRALAMLLDIRDTERGIKGFLELAEKRALLRDIAWRLTQANRVELSKARALEYVELKLRGLPNVDKPADDVLHHLLERSGVLRQPIPGKVDFIHRTFQEYLAASEATEQAHIDTLVANAHLDSWRETIVMACGHAKKKQADDLLTEIMNRADKEPRNARRLWLLAAACLETVTEIDPKVHERVETLIREHLVPPRNIRESASLATIGHRLLRYLPSTLEDLSEAQAAATVRTAVLTGNAEALTRLAGYAADERWTVQEQLAAGWEYFDPQRYAEEVLADAPLLNGLIDIESTRLLPHVKLLKRLKWLGIGLLRAKPLPSLDFVADLPDIIRLSARMNATTVDLAPLVRHRKLRSITLIHVHGYTSLASLAELPRLTMLNLYQYTPWPDVEFLRQHPQLTDLTLDRLSEVRDFAPLDDLVHLRTLQLWDDVALNSTTNKAWPHVRSLGIYNSHEDIAQIPVAFPGLTQLTLRQIPIPDLTPITRLPLTFLELDGDNVDLSPLKDKKLKLILTRDGTYRGLDKLGPGVTVKYE
ncbi:NACHT domain-containing protein [Actinocrispum sp. NPDC049592]|uniref:NACHT domain-containing protein n=1 Tax=Actinocrispum sp. NPDC049592 TaxID=3154835 RepID=UPI0034318ED9